MAEPDSAVGKDGDAFELITVERKGHVGLIQLNRPKSLNALNDLMSREILSALRNFDSDDGVGAIVIIGSGKAFAAGADIAEMMPKSFVDMYTENYFGAFDSLAGIRKPIIAAVNGFALGGGCELAMMCDIVIAARSAKFGQPEIKLGILPGIGGTQRLPRLVGRTFAMDMILTGRLIAADEAMAAGLVSRVVDDVDLLTISLDAAATIASYNLTAVLMAKEAVNRADEASLAQGLLQERRLFQAAFATSGQKEGMAAFLEKRAPAFDGR